MESKVNVRGKPLVTLIENDKIAELKETIKQYDHQKYLEDRIRLAVRNAGLRLDDYQESPLDSNNRIKITFRYSDPKRAELNFYCEDGICNNVQEIINEAVDLMLKDKKMAVKEESQINFLEDLANLLLKHQKQKNLGVGNYTLARLVSSYIDDLEMFRKDAEEFENA